MSTLDALRSVLDPALATRARAQLPAAWDELPDGSLIVTSLLDGPHAVTARLRRVGAWRASLDPACDHAHERACVELAAAASRQLAHDLQTPLAAAAAHVELTALGGAEAADAVRLLHALGALHATRALRYPLVADELPGDLDGLLRIEATLAREFARHGARWRFDASVDHAAPPGGSAMQSALVILGENALNAVKQGGRAVDAEVRHDGEHVVLRVADDGPGIDPAVAAALAAPLPPRGARARRGLWTLRVIATSLHGALSFSPRTPRGLDARVALSSRPLRPASPGSPPSTTPRE